MTGNPKHLKYLKQERKAYFSHIKSQEVRSTGLVCCSHISGVQTSFSYFAILSTWLPSHDPAQLRVLAIALNSDECGGGKGERLTLSL